MGISKPGQETIDKTIIRQIESFEVDESQYANDPFFAVISCPVSEKKLDSLTWIRMYREMLPKHNHTIDYTVEVFGILTDIYMDLSISEVSIIRDKLVHEKDAAIKAGKWNLEDYGMLTPENIFKLEAKAKRVFFAKYDSIKNDSVYTYTDEYREFMSSEEIVKDFSNKKVAALWRLVSLNPTIVPFNAPSLKKLDPKVLSCYTPMETPEDYANMYREAKAGFYEAHPGFKRINTTPEIWDEWLEYYVCISALQETIALKFAPSIEALVAYDVAYAKIMRNAYLTDFVQFDIVIQTGFGYSTTNLGQRIYSKVKLHDEDSTEELHTLLNSITVKHWNLVTCLLRAFDPEMVTSIAISESTKFNIKQGLSVFACFEVVKDKEIIKRKLIETTNKSNPLYWTAYALCLSEGVFGDMTPLEFLETEYQKLTNSDDRLSLLKGMCDVTLHAYDKFACIKDALATLVNQELANSKLTAREKFLMTDTLNHVMKYGTETENKKANDSDDESFDREGYAEVLDVKNL